MMERHCRECGSTLVGRSDQKFCNDHCRNSYNNRLNKAENSYVQNVGRILRKNRRILRDLNQHYAKTDRYSLLNRGFDFTFYTNIRRTQPGEECFYCFEYGYLPLENDYFALVKNNDI